jgi:hypothetical protein
MAKGAIMRTLEVATGDGGNPDDWRDWEDEVRLASERGGGVGPLIDVGGMRKIGSVAASGSFTENYRSPAVVPRAFSPIVIGKSGMGDIIQFGP